MGRGPRLDSVSLSHHSPLQRVLRNRPGEGNRYGSARWRLGGVLLHFRTGCHLGIRSGGHPPTAAYILRRPPGACALLRDLLLVYRIPAALPRPFFLVV